jgi:hypothetical protein
MRFCIPLMLGVFLLAYISPRPEFSKPDGRILLMQPYLLRAMSGYARSIASDFIWLKSHYVDESRYGENVDMEVFPTVFRAQITLDPHFTAPVRYAATYLASLPKRPDMGIELLQLSQSFNPDRFDLLINEALIRIGYDVPNSSDRLLELAKRIEVLPEKTKLLGLLPMDDWMIEVISYARTKEGKLELIEADLIDLLKQTESPERRALIEAELEEVRQQKGQN